ncbi:helix-turn-helix domain-containing protein [Saccharibacillus sp. O23]|uniref:helix-turn-helix domain-containing protein n=1 Tax=Saccharibacillus sp. O23 TaxID=2009338 RepID=UPI00211B0EA1|nr:helix-turn-helix transcriptional regulator [Saccharibacillus sp. O23]
MATFGSRLKLLRSEKRLTQKDFAKLMNISESAVGMYERDEREPSFKILNQIADYFGVSYDYLLGSSIARTPEEGMAFSDGGRNWTEEEMQIAESIIETLRKQQGK